MPIPSNLNHQEKILLAHILSTTVEKLMTEPPEMTVAQKSEFQKKSNLLNENYPLDYLLGEVNINGLTLILTEDVLIPRPETEEWINHLKSILEHNLYLDSLTYQEKILHSDYQLPELEIISQSGLLVDIGCGSGLIGLSLAKYFKHVLLSDISSQGLEIARKNAVQNRIYNCNCVESNLFENPELFNQIAESENNWYLVANLPYLPSSDKGKNVKTNLRFEPELALYSGQFGLDLFQQLINQLKILSLKPRIAIFELDPRNMMLANQLLRRIYPRTIIWKDENGFERVLVGVA